MLPVAYHAPKHALHVVTHGVHFVVVRRDGQAFDAFVDGRQDDGMLLAKPTHLAGQPWRGRQDPT